LGVPSTRLNGYRVSPSAVQAIPEKLARKHLAIPLQKVGQMLQVAIAVPTDLAALDELRFASGCQIQTFVALEDEIADAVDRCYAAASDGIPAEESAASLSLPPVTIDRRDLSRPDRRTTNYGRRRSDRAVDEVFASGDEETAVAAVDRFL